MRERTTDLLLAALAVVSLAAASAASAAPQAKFSASRSEGCTAPCAIFFDATATSDASTRAPFHDLDFRWDFGDERGETWDVSGLPRNQGVGGIAGHLYTHPGRFTVTLAVTNPAGQRVVVEQTVEVADPDAVHAGDRTTCVSASGDFAGCPAGAQQVKSADFDGSIANQDGRRTLFRRGDTFNWDRPVQLVSAAGKGATLGAFGSGTARPIAQAQGPVGFDPGDDWRISQLTLRGPRPAGQSTFVTEHEGVSRFTVNDVEVLGFNSCGTFWSPQKPDVQVAFVNVRCAEFPDPGVGTKFYEDTQESMFLGLDLDKGDHTAPDDKTEFAYRTVFSVKKLIQHSRFQGRAPNYAKNLLQLRHCSNEGPWLGRCPDGKVPSRYVLVSDNHFIEGGGPRGLTVIRVCDHGGCTGKPGSSQPVLDYIFERNLFQVDARNPGAEQLEGVLMLQSAHTTVRNNVADLAGWPSGGPRRMAFAVAVPFSNPGRDRGEAIHVLDNTVFMGEGYPGSALLCGAPRGGAKLVCMNNLLYAPRIGGARATTLGTGWADLGNLMDGATGPGRFDGNPFASAKIPKLGTKRRDLANFRLSGRVDGGTNPVKGGKPASVETGIVYDDAFGDCRRLTGPPDVGASQLGAKPCPPAKPRP